jgi:hypothetical protein
VPIQLRKDNLFSKCCWKNWISSCRKLKLDPYLSHCIRINSKQIKNLNIRPDFEASVGKSREYIGINGHKE